MIWSLFKVKQQIRITWTVVVAIVIATLRNRAIVKVVPFPCTNILAICCIMPKINAPWVINNTNQLIFWILNRRMFRLGDKRGEIKLVWEVYFSIYFLFTIFSIWKSLELDYKNTRQSKDGQFFRGLSQFYIMGYFTFAFRTKEIIWQCLFS